MTGPSIQHEPAFNQKTGVTIVKLPPDGIVKPMDVQQVCQIIEQHIKDAPQGQDYLFSFKQVKYISSMFIGHLMSFYKLLAAKQGKLMLCDTDPQVASVIRLARLERQMPIYPDQAQAITGRTPALTGCITLSAIASFTGLAMLVRLIVVGHESLPRTLVAILLLLHLPLPVLAWLYRRKFSSLNPVWQWGLVAGGCILLILLLLTAII